jgi:two-component system NtrC family sensor kinase
MERAAKPAKAKVEARPPIARKSRKTDASTGRQLEQRLTEALEQQAATSEILRVISSSQTDVQPVFDTILENAIRLCEGDTARLFQYDGQVLRIAAAKNTTLEGDVHLRENPPPLGTYNPTPQAGLERRAIHVLDVFAEPGYRPLVPPGTTTHRPRPNAPTVLAVPLLREGELLGVITVWRYAVDC